MRRLTALLPLLCGLLLAGPAHGLNPDIPLRDLNHTIWGDKDGVPQNAGAMVQTRDGWLWVASKDGLFRFDGVKFERYRLPFNQINNLHALSNGGLLLTYYFDGVAILHPDGRLEELNRQEFAKVESPGSLDMDADGVVWAVSDSGVHRYRQGHWETLMSGQEWHSDFLSLLIDQYDRIWVGSTEHVYLFDRKADRFQPIPGEGLRESLTQSPDGQIWSISPDGALPVPMPPTGRLLPRRPDFNQLESRNRAQFDRDGNLWVLRCPVGLCRVPRENIRPGRPIVFARDIKERLDQYWQLSSLATGALLEDREGNVWVTTQSGIDRFRTNKLVPAHIPSRSGIFSIATDTEGQLWAAEFTDGTLWKVTPGREPEAQPAQHVQVLGNDRDGALLMVGKREITRVYKGSRSTIALPTVAGKPADLKVLGVLDDGKVLWMMSLQTGLMGLVDGQWLPRAAFKLPARITMSAPGDTGQLWLTHNDRKLSLYDNGKLSLFDIALVGTESGIFPGPQLIVAGERGIAMRRGRQFVMLGPPDVEALRNVTGLVMTPDGDRWLNGAKGIVHIRRADWESALRQPAQPLKFELFDVLDGYPGRAAFDNRLVTMIAVGSDRLWVRASGGLVRLDLNTMSANTVKPTVQLLRVEAAGATYPTAGLLRLAPDNGNFNIQYTAPGLRKPEGMRFQYKLDGFDHNWQDAGTRRVAYYTNVGPGNYLFHVRAVNEDGVYSESTASLPIEVQPSVMQTWWFRSLCVVLLAGIGFALYKARIRIATRQITRQVQTRMQAGLAERERIARTLHDTFLQSVQALALQIHAVALGLPEEDEARAKLRKILKRATSAMDEGRAQVQQLRRGTDPVLKLSQLGDYLMMVHPGTAFELGVTGVRRELGPTVQEELGEIGQEAIRNAFQHAAASLVKAEIDYGVERLTLRVSDNGKGLDDNVRKSGVKKGRWGLVGMRERAHSLGVAIIIDGKPGAGTTVEVRIPATLAYAA